MHEGHGNMTTIEEFKRRGGTIKQLPPHHKKTKQNQQYGEEFHNCGDCSHYRNGKGDKLCLKCKQYNQFKTQSTSRPKIIIESVPQAILEAIEDTPKLTTILNILKILPLDKSTPLMMQYFLGATLQEIAKYHKISKQAVDAKNKLSIEIIIKTLKQG